MPTHEEHELLTRVGPGTPIGALFRRSWIPAFRSDDVPAGGDPKRVRLLGENFVAYRDRDGLVGLLDESCPHRGASLAIGRAEACGIRCLYHGWLVAPDGRVLETPPEPEEYGFKDRVRARSAPVREAGGIAWAYLGPAEDEPELRTFAFCSMPPANVLIVTARIERHYVHVLEGAIHASVEWLAPFYGIRSAPNGSANMQAMVPIDDESTMVYDVTWSDAGPISAPERAQHEERRALGFDDRGEESLGAADAAALRMRRRLIDAARALAAGETPLGLDARV